MCELKRYASVDLLVDKVNYIYTASMHVKFIMPMYLSVECCYEAKEIKHIYILTDGHSDLKKRFSLLEEQCGQSLSFSGMN